MKRLTSLLLALLMVAGSFGTVFASIKADENNHIDYVSFGASVTNGYGLRGYLPDEVVADPFLADKSKLNVFGFDMAPPEGYPALVTKELESKGYTVSHKQYAISSMRVEELRVLLDNEYDGDDYTAWRFTGGEKWFDKAAGSLENARKLYQDAVKESELITIEIGVNNFGVYSFNNIKDIVKNGGTGYWKEPDFSILFTEEEQKEFDKAKEYVLSELAKVGTDEKMMNMLDKIANVLAYATVGYMRNFDKVMEKIYELNPDANVVVITIQNLMEGVDMKINGVTVPIGDIYGTLIDTANMYTAVGSPYSDRYSYAKASKGDLARTFLDELLEYNGDPTTFTPSMKDCFDMYDDNLYLRSKLQYIIAPWIVLQMKGVDVPLNELINIAMTGIVGKNFNALSGEQLSILMQVVDILGAGAMFGIPEQTEGPDPMYVQLLMSPNYQKALNTAYDIAAKIMKEFGEVTTLEIDLENFAADYANAEETLINYITNSAFEGAISVLTSQEEDYEYEFVMDESLLEDENIVASAVLLLRFMVGNSFFAHPNAEGHADVKAAVMDALEYSTTGEDYAIIEVRDALMYLAQLVSENGPQIAEGLYDYAEKNGYIDDVKDALSVLEKKVYDALDEYADKIIPEVEEKINALDKFVADQIAQIELLTGKAQEELIPYIEGLKENLAKAQKEYENVVSHINEYHPEEKQAVLEAAENAVNMIREQISSNEAILSRINESIAVLGKEVEEAKAVIANIKAKIGEVGTEVEKLALIAKDVIENVEELITKTFEDVDVNDIENELKKIAKELEDAAVEIIDAALYAETTREIVSRVNDAYLTLCGQLGGRVDIIEEFITNDMNELVKELQNIAKAASPKAEEVLGRVIGEVKAIGELSEELISEIKDSVDVLAKEGTILAEVLMDEAKKAIAQVEDAVREAYAEATTGEYTFTADSYYVNIGGSITTGKSNYADKLAGEMGYDPENFKDLGNAALRAEDIRYILDENYKPDHYSEEIVKNVEELRALYTSEIKKADLITVGVGNFTPIVIEQVRRVAAGEEPIRLDWARYVGKDHVQYVEDAVAQIEKFFEEAGLGEFAGVKFSEVLTATVESCAYAYAGFSLNYAEMINDIHEINPEAEVIVVGSYNPLKELSVQIEGEEMNIGEYVDYLIEIMDIQFLAYSMLTPKTTFVEVNDTEVEKAYTSVEDLAMSVILDTKINPSEAGHEYIKTQILKALDITVDGLLGDVNLDGKVNAIDATQILRKCNNKASVFTNAKGYKLELINHNADVDTEEGINAVDATQILRYCNNKPSSLVK
ncbi:MAG: hypothetical protein IKM61_01025 [Eubacteriaceae bacterium]|nr:hypothetical protein [Eubacteriaceae bacterium]